MNIGERLKTAREAIGYTLDKVEKESGIGASSLSEYENNKREPKFSQLSKLAEHYKRSMDYFLTDELPIEPVMLWRDGSKNPEEKLSVEAEFRQLCQQYNKLESITAENRKNPLPKPGVENSDQFSWPQVEVLARDVHKCLSLGDIPSTCLKRILEERLYVKIFHLEFTGSAISTFSEEFGPAILLNLKNVAWRRNYDLAHELFHLLTWNIFRSKNIEPDDSEEKFADSFASKLLMPEESLKKRLASIADEQGETNLEQLDDLAREFGVSIDAILYRIASLYRFKKEDTDKFLVAAKQLAQLHKPRESDKPETLPERYCHLAQRALREGKLSLMQFAKYMNISYNKAQEYLAEDEDFKDEKISIPFA